MARFDPDGDCKAWCIDQAICHLNLPQLPRESVRQATPIMRRASLFASLGCHYFLGLPKVALLNPRILIGLGQHRGRVSFNPSKFVKQVEGARDLRRRYCLFYEVGAHELYGLQDVWMHTVVECGANHNWMLADGLREVLENERAVPHYSDQWYMDRLTRSRCAKLLIVEPNA